MSEPRIYDSEVDGPGRYYATTSGWAIEGRGPTRELAIADLQVRLARNRELTAKALAKPSRKSTATKKSPRVLDAEIAEFLAQGKAERSSIPGLAGAAVLAGAYKGTNIDQRETLTHAVSTQDVTIGRMKRDAGDAFCNPKLNLVDSVVYTGKSTIDCPACLAIVKRAG